MVEHVRVLGWLALVRSLVGAVLGGYCLYATTREQFVFYAEPGDALALRIFGGVLIGLAVPRALQGVAALLTVSWARLPGLLFGIFDCVNLAFFPVSTALGLYALVTYRHPETIEHFKARR